ncbi:hypothetical protein CAPTEDRAFT_214741 [Capitella teleta]|uniref:Uncharacterized protein n=1 Tax=Capitella teleta TaxID=283909 RepID=R7V2P3_CAPTE|nr:hypothetical protein CAPTEDRAFT_214741 [Capitella teleta]|eukprot:ELU13118.1 hypothetical protein CAPTEDRAFT_214741 [Capitella teleta]
MAWSKEDMRNGNARQRASPHRKALIVSCVFLTLLFVYTYGITVIRFFAPCPSRSELEFQLRDFIKYRSSQTKSEQDKDAAMKNLTGANVAWNDPKLVSVVKNHFVDPPRPYVTKFSLPLTQTPQAKAADAILKGKATLFPDKIQGSVNRAGVCWLPVYEGTDFDSGPFVALPFGGKLHESIPGR